MYAPQIKFGPQERSEAECIALGTKLGEQLRKERSMHDAKGRELKEGDQVLIPMRIKRCYGGDDYCNVELESVFGRRPDSLKERLTISSMNTGVCLRANKDDENNIAEFFCQTE